MESKLIICVCIVIVTLLSLCCADEVKLRVEGVTSIAKTDDHFVCATLDWWPHNKCDYNQCPWGNAGLLNLNLNNTILANAIKAFDSLRIRLGGSLQDQVVYRVGRHAQNCHDFKRKDGGLFGFSKGCLPMKRWDQLNKFFNQTGARVTFSLNALSGRKEAAQAKAAAGGATLMEGKWDPRNAYDFIKYTASKGYKIDSYELGNELCGSGVSARVDAEQYGKDMIVLKKIIKHFYTDYATRPKLLGPGGFYDEEWFKTLLQTTGPNVIDGLTHHTYNLGVGVDPNLIYKVQDPYFLDKVAQTYKDMATSVQSYGPWAGAWVGEAGGAYNSGGRYVSHAFANGFWYLDQLGMTSTFNHKAFCRQALIGGNYALLNTTTFIPNPDYYGPQMDRKRVRRNTKDTRTLGRIFSYMYSHSIYSFTI